MKNKKAIVITSAAIVFTAVATASIYAAFNSISDNTIPEENLPTPIIQDETLDRNSFPAREGAEEEKQYVNDNGEIKELKYSYTLELPNNKYWDVYLDSDKNEYKYDTNGNLAGYSDNLQKGFNEENEINPYVNSKEKIMASKAEDHFKETYGDRFNGMIFRDYSNESDYYSISFARVYGKDGFASGATCQVVFNSDGSIMYSNIYDGEEYDSFNASLCENVTEYEVVARAKENTDEIFGHCNIVTNDVKGNINAKVIDGRSVLIATVVITAETYPTEEEIEKYDVTIAYGEQPTFAYRYVYDLEN